jgi:hypothetical protein
MNPQMLGVRASRFEFPGQKWKSEFSEDPEHGETPLVHAGGGSGRIWRLRKLAHGNWRIRKGRGAPLPVTTEDIGDGMGQAFRRRLGMPVPSF